MPGKNFCQLKMFLAICKSVIVLLLVGQRLKYSHNHVEKVMPAWINSCNKIFLTSIEWICGK